MSFLPPFSPPLSVSLSLSLSFYFCVYNAHRLRESQQDSKELPKKYWICFFTCLDWRESIQFESYSTITPKLKFGKISKVNITHWQSTLYISVHSKRGGIDVGGTQSLSSTARCACLDLVCVCSCFSGLGVLGLITAGVRFKNISVVRSSPLELE